MEEDQLELVEEVPTTSAPKGTERFVFMLDGDVYNMEVFGSREIVEQALEDHSPAGGIKDIINNIEYPIVVKSIIDWNGGK
jgi:hypothetical protein